MDSLSINQRYFLLEKLQYCDYTKFMNMFNNIIIKKSYGTITQSSDDGTITQSSDGSKGYAGSALFGMAPKPESLPMPKFLNK